MSKSEKKDKKEKKEKIVFEEEEEEADEEEQLLGYLYQKFAMSLEQESKKVTTPITPKDLRNMAWCSMMEELRKVILEDEKK